jgi:ABC-2 type transport system permease protein
MNKISLIIQREYLTRVRKKSFLIMSIVGPLLLGALMVVPVWLATMNDDTKQIEVLDESGLFAGSFKANEDSEFIPVGGSLAQAKAAFLKQEEHEALLYIPRTVSLEQPRGIQLFGASNPSLKLQSDIQKLLEKQIEERKFKASGIDKEVLDKIETDIKIGTVNLSDEGEKKSNSAVNTAIGMTGAILIYFFIFLYGVQIMRGVMEEKTNRIVEVVISSVKPFQLMMGKIIGIALVGLTQLMIWVVLSLAITTFVGQRFKTDRFKDANLEQTMQDMKSPSDIQQAQQMNEVMSSLDGINIPGILATFLFYFLGGYLLYGALFGAIGAAVDNETDTQQFMLPITIPLILSFVVAQSVILKDPNGTLAFWMSMIPLTSPIVMMMRMPFGVPLWQLLLSMALLVAGFVFTVWLAGRIYRVGILMYGKKVSYNELRKWLFYKA